MSRFEHVRTEKLYDANFISLVSRIILDNETGENFERVCVEHIGAVAIIPVLENGDTVLVRQYRSSIDDYSLEVVAGRRDHIDEDIIECAQRELREEVGYSAGVVSPLGYIHTSPGFTNERIYLFLATECTQLESTQPDSVEESDSEIVRCTQEEALQWSRDGTISDAKSIIAVNRMLVACEKLGI